jgi:membrane associated rhomboid family serine protease
VLHDLSSVAHVAGNVAFLVMFGGIVERALGYLRFLGLYVAAGIAGAALHVLVVPSATVPLVGAFPAVTRRYK